MQKWEYSIVKHHKFDEIWIFFSNGYKDKLKKEQGEKQHEFVAEVLASMGSEGWELVNFMRFMNKKDGSYSTFPGADVEREFMFKRPIGE